MKKHLIPEEGQSTLLVVVTLVVLIGLVALVLDIGNAYAQRRIAQNAADAGAMAAGLELAKGPEYTTNHEVRAEAEDYGEMNGFSREAVSVFYVHFDPDTRQTTDMGPVPDNTAPPPEAATGVRVHVGKFFDTFLARVLGFDTLAAAAEAVAWTSKGICSPGSDPSLFPVAVDVDRRNEVGMDTPTMIWGDMVTGGNFQWVSWDEEAGHTSLQTLIENMTGTPVDYQLAPPRTEDFVATVYSGPGVEVAAQVRAELDRRIADTNCEDGGINPVLLPLYAHVENPGEAAVYDVVGFTGFCITGYDFAGRDKRILGYFVDKNVNSTEGGCPDFGTHTVKLRPALNLTRNITGQVAYERLKLTEVAGTAEHPVDVMYVVDVSGSMGDSWGSGVDYEQKLQTAKDVLSEFNSSLRPEVGDRAGLVKFPVNRSLFPAPYAQVCGGTSSEQVGAGIVRALTTDLAAVQADISSLAPGGNTSIAAGIYRAVEAFSDPNNQIDGHQQIIIVLSDGMGNVSLDRHLTGWSGGGAEPDCNKGASSEAIDMANNAKASGITVFTIAVGDQFLTYVLEAMATPDSDPDKEHFYVASNPTALQEIYVQLGDRITNLRECVVLSEDAAGAGAVVTIFRDGVQVGQTTTDAAGNFLFNAVEPGNYTFSATLTDSGTTYDVHTNKVGGYELESPPALEVPDAAGTYYMNLALKTDTPPQCDL